MTMKNKMTYDFNKPIHIVRLKANGLDIIFYTFIFSVLAAIILIVLCMKDGKFGLYLDLWRVLVSFPLIILAYFVIQPLRELRTYIPQLAKRNTWTIEEMMKLTKKDRPQTEKIMTRVLESGFIVESPLDDRVDQ